VDRVAARIGYFFKSISNGAIGIVLEILLVIFFIFTGFLVCLLWWGIFR